MASKEKKGLEQWTEGGTDETRSLSRIWDLTGSYKKSYRPDVDAGLERLRTKIQSNTPPAKVHSLRSRFAFVRIAASVALLLVAGYFLKSYLSDSPAWEVVASADDAKKEIPLIDGTNVTLNENSELSFPEKFDAKRTVALTGEAFFDVAKDAEKPFEALMENVKVRVLGTSFNIRAYPNEDFVEVYVNTGKVAVEIDGSDEIFELTPGMKWTYSKSASKVETILDASANVMAWKSGKLLFKNESMDNVLATIERLFDVELETAPGTVLDCPLTTGFQAEYLPDVLKAIEATCSDLKVSEVAEGSYQISGKCCQ